MVELAIVLTLLLALLIYLVIAGLKLKGLVNQEKNDWIKIDKELDKKIELSKELLVSIKTYMPSERGLIDCLDEFIRGYFICGTKQAALSINLDIEQVVAKTYEYSSSHPEIEFDEHFLLLQEEIMQSQRKIEYACKMYNRNIKAINKLVINFPSDIAAKIMKIKKYEYLNRRGTL